MPNCVARPGLAAGFFRLPIMTGTNTNPPIADQLSQLNWIISVFNLTSAAFLPFWAQVADIFSRHATIHTTIILMSLADYALNWTLFAVISGVGFSIGPVIGGYLTRESWRWCFAINLPVGVLAIVLVVLVLRRELLGPQPIPELGEGEGGYHEGHRHRVREMGRRERFGQRLMTVDYVGQLLFLFGLGLLILAFTWAGGTYGWGSAAVVAPLVVGAMLSVAWVFYEYSMAPSHLMSRVFPSQRAMMPWELLAKRDISLLFFANFDLGVSIFAVMFFMDLYFALVEGHSSSEAWLALLYFLPGLGGEQLPSPFSVFAPSSLTSLSSQLVHTCPCFA